MTSVWYWKLRRFLRRVWVRIAAFGVLGVVSALLAAVMPPVIPDSLIERLGSSAVVSILEILASSMLAVTTFSVSIMLTAFGAAAAGATPRATALLKDDRVTQSVLATFMGAFIFSLVGIIALQTEVYPPSGRFVMFVTTALVLGAVVAQLVRWIGHLSDFGRLSDTMARVEDAATRALTWRMAHPFLDGQPASLAPGGGAEVRAQATGYVQVVDMSALQAAAEAESAQVVLVAVAGSFVHPGTVLARVVPVDAFAAMHGPVCAAFAVAPARSYDQDPRFGLLTMTEIASRALSPAVNDPGTAIDVLGRHLRVLSLWRERAVAEMRFDRVFVPPLRLDDAMSDAFDAIARDGAGLLEVQVRLQKALAGLVAQDAALYGPTAARLSDRALRLSAGALTLEEDRARVAALAAGVAKAAAGTAPVAPKARA